MNWKLPVPYLVLLFIYSWAIGVYFLRIKGNSQFLSILSGSGISAVTSVISYYSIIWSLNKSNRNFFLSLSIGTILRFSILISSIFIAYNFARIYFFSFVLSLLFTYLLFLITEVYVVFRFKLKK
jgi:hypothetical protein